MSERTHNIKIQLSLDSMMLAGESKDENGINDSSNPLVQKIVDSIRDSFLNRSTVWIDEFVNELSEGNAETAEKIYCENKFALMLLTDSRAVLKLRNSQYHIFEGNLKREFLLTVISLCRKLGITDNLELDIDSLIEMYGEEADNDLLMNLKLEKANVAAMTGRYNQARIIFMEILESKECEAATKAWAYQGLSKIATSIEDKCEFAEKAADSHLVAGKHFEAIKNYMFLAENTTNIKESLSLIDASISLNDLNNVLDKEVAASLYQKKALKLLSTGRLSEALACAKTSCDLRRTIVIKPEIQYSALQTVCYIAKRLGDTETEILYNEESKFIASTIDDEEFKIQARLQEIVQMNAPLEKSLEDDVLSIGIPRIEFSLLLYKATSTECQLPEKMELLDKARVIAEKINRNHELSSVHFAIAEEYRKQKSYIPALENYRISLRFDPFNSASSQNCAAMLMESGLYIETEKFFSERIAIVGKLPNISFAYAKALMNLGRYSDALEYLQIASSVRDVRDLIIDCVQHGAKIPALMILEPAPFISLAEFHKSLHEFSKSISSDSRMQFWKRDDQGAYKWISNPESFSKHLLITFLNGYFKYGAVEILQESRAGAGFIDLYVLLRGGLKVVIELKMCGAGYSSGYALSGNDQIVHYLDNRDTKVGFLIVFDSRKRDLGKGMIDMQSIDGKIIYSISIDLRTEF